MEIPAEPEAATELAFEESEPAARRREFVHHVLAASTEALLREQVHQPPRLAVDLGCGPGLSTVCLAEVTGARLVMGLDISASFIRLAQRFATPRRVFGIHDVCEAPFPVGPSDLLYARLLLSYLPEPSAVLDQWATQLQAGGLLIIEEVESIESDHPQLRTYLDLVARAVAQEGASLYPGPLLDELRPGPTLRRRLSVVRHVEVDNAQAAAMFGANLTLWRAHPFIQAEYSTEMLDDLQAALSDLAGNRSSGQDSDWGIRQMVFERV